MKILITGASSGIAYLLGITLASRGHFVYMTTHTDKEKDKLKEKVATLGLKIIIFKLDVTDIEDCKILDKLDIDVLINNASIGVGGSILDLPMDKVRYNFEVNYFAMYDLVKRVSNNMLKTKKRGKIIIMSSQAGIIPIPFLGSYCSTKSAISTMATSLRRELKLIKAKIDIILIEPGAYKTGFNQFMIDDIDRNTTKGSIFYNNKYKIHNKLSQLFNLIEKKKVNSIVEKIIIAVEKDKPKKVYRAPLLQKIFTKIYLIFIK